MAATIAIATGYDKSGREKTTTRLGSEGAHAEANTWRTFTIAHVNADGSGHVEVRRGNPGGQVLHSFRFGPEAEEEEED